jgi:hypothetical protein
MGAACFKSAGDGGLEGINESWVGSIGSATSKGRPTPARCKTSPDSVVHHVKGANNSLHDSLHERDVQNRSLGAESKSESRSASSASSSTRNRSDLPGVGAGVNPHFRKVGKAVPFSPRRGFQVLSEDAPSLKLEACAGRQRQKPAAISPTVPKLPERDSELDLSDDDGHSMPVEMARGTSTAWVPGGETSEFAEATAALQHYYASEMPGHDSEMPGASHIDFKLPTVSYVRDDCTPAACSIKSSNEYEAAMNSIGSTQSGNISTEPVLNRDSNQAMSMFDSPFVKQSNGHLWHNTFDSDGSSAAKDSVQNGGSNSAASSAVVSLGKQGSVDLPSTTQQTSKDAIPDGTMGSSRQKKLKSKPKNSKVRNQP